MSTPQNPYGPDNGSGNQNPDGQNPYGQDQNGQSPNAPGYGNDQNPGQQPQQSQPGQQPDSGQQPQYGSSNDSNPSYGSQPNYGQDANSGSQDFGQQPPQYGSQPPQYGSQPSQPGQGYDNNAQYGQGGYDQNQPGQGGYGQGGYDQNQYGQGGYDQNAQYDANQYGANQYGQQPAYAGADGSDQFTPANPNAAYGQFPSGTGGNTSKNIWGILALIGGIVGILLSLVFGSGALFGIAAIIFGFVGLSAIKKGLASNKGLNITGIILGFVAVLLSIVAVIVTFLGIGLLGTAISEAEKSSSPTAAPVDPSQDPDQDPSEGTSGSDGSSSSDGSNAPAVEGGEVTIGTDLTAAVAAAPSTTTGIGAESTNGEIAAVTVTFRNNSSEDIDLSSAQMDATDGGSKEYDDVFEGTKYKGSLVFDTVPAGGEKTVQIAFAVPKDKVDGMVLELSLPEDLGNGTDFKFKKQ